MGHYAIAGGCFHAFEALADLPAPGPAYPQGRAGIRDAPREAIQPGFGRWLRAVPSMAGLHVAAEVAPGVSLDVDEVVRRAKTSGIFVHSLAEFSAQTSPPSGLVRGYGAISTPTIEEGLRRLIECFRAT